MKKQYNAPILSINKYIINDVITVSSNMIAMANDMKAKGFSITTFKLNS